MPQFVGSYVYDAGFVPFGGIQPGGHYGPDLNGVTWSYAMGRHSNRNPDDFGSWIFGWSGSPFSTQPIYRFYVGSAQGTLNQNPISKSLLFTTTDQGQEVLYRINEAKFS